MPYGLTFPSLPLLALRNAQRKKSAASRPFGRLSTILSMCAFSRVSVAARKRYFLCPSNCTQRRRLRRRDEFNKAARLMLHAKGNKCRVRFRPRSEMSDGISVVSFTDENKRISWRSEYRRTSRSRKSGAGTG